MMSKAAAVTSETREHWEVKGQCPCLSSSIHQYIIGSVSQCLYIYGKLQIVNKDRCTQSRTGNDRHNENATKLTIHSQTCQCAQGQNRGSLSTTCVGCSCLTIKPPLTNRQNRGKRGVSRRGDRGTQRARMSIVFCP